jgi:hypothetical protein
MNIIGNRFAAKPMYFELAIDQPPPILVLTINPENLNFNLTKKVTQSRNRPATRDAGAYIYNFSFDELDTITCSGETAMFYVNNGLTTVFRKDSLGYRNFNSLVQIYRNNGRNYVTRPSNNSPLVTGGSGLIKSVGRVIIAYDDVIYYGSFDSFNYEEVDTKPFNFTFDFQFVVSNTQDVRNA